MQRWVRFQGDCHHDHQWFGAMRTQESSFLSNAPDEKNGGRCNMVWRGWNAESLYFTIHRQPCSSCLGYIRWASYETVVVAEDILRLFHEAAQRAFSPETVGSSGNTHFMLRNRKRAGG